MSLAKKIFLLIILLLLLMITCVYTHIDDFMDEQSTTVSSSNEVALEKTAMQWINDFTVTLTEKFISQEEKTIPEIEVKEVVKAKEIKIEEVIVEEPTHELPKAAETTNEPIQVKSSKEVIKPLPFIEVKEKPKQEVTIKKPVVEVLQVEIASQMPIKSYDEIQKELDTITTKKRIIFKRLSTDVTQESQKTIEEIAKLLKKHEDIKVEIGGHTDAKGDEEVNAYVSKHRALSVRKLLIKAGVNEQRLTAKGYGESQPIVKNDAQGYSMKNRRVEFKIIKE